MEPQVPRWLNTIEYSRLSPARKCFWSKADYLDKTLADIMKVLAEDMDQAGASSKLGLLQRIEPRGKVGMTVLLLISVAMTHSLSALATVHVGLVLAALASGLSPMGYCKRVWIPALFFVGTMTLPGSLSWITPGEPILTLYPGLYVSKQGLASATFVVLRSATSLALVVLLVKTTRWSLLTKAMGSLGIPNFFIMVLELTYRYIFLFLLLLTEYLQGRKSRLVAKESHQSRLAWIGLALAGFFRLVWEYGQEIGQAMQARGYDGENRQRLIARPGIVDGMLFIVVIITCWYLI